MFSELSLATGEFVPPRRPFIESQVNSNINDTFLLFMSGDYPWINLCHFTLIAFPNAIAAVDCTHVHIECPSGAHEANYVNQKLQHRINVQVSPSAYYKIALNDCKSAIPIHHTLVIWATILISLIFSAPSCPHPSEMFYIPTIPV